MHWQLEIPMVIGMHIKYVDMIWASQNMDIETPNKVVRRRQFMWDTGQTLS